MPERSSIAQTVQVGVESVPGTTVAADKKLAAMSIEPKSEGDVNVFRSTGYLYDSVAVTGREWASAALSGEATYNEIVYPLSSVLKTAEITTPGGGTTSRQWLFTPSVVGGDTVKTFTVERGDATNAYKFGYGLVTDFTITWNRQDVAISGTMLGQKLSRGITMTASPTSLALVPVAGKDISVYIDPTSGALGTTKLLRVFEAEMRIQNRYAALWALNQANPSFAAHVETQPTVELTVRAMRDATSDAIYDSLADNSSRYVRVDCVGPLIETTINHTLRLDFSGKLSAMPEMGATENVDAYTFVFRTMVDPAWGSGKAYEVTAINTLTAL